MGREKNRWFGRLAAMALTLSVFAACGDDDATAPGDLDPGEAAATMDQVVDQFIEENQAVQSLGVFTGVILGAVGGPNIVPVAAVPAPGDGLTGWADRLRMSSSKMLESGVTANIPVGLLGATLVFNPETGQYEIDSTRTGAPANGVRFILYAVDPVLGEPILPLEEIGYIDIVDTSNFPTANISMTAVIGGVTLIDIDVSGTFSETSIDLLYSGFLSDGQNQLDFEIDGLFTEFSFALDFEASFGTFTVGIGFSGDANLETGTFTASFSDGADTISFTLSVTGETIGSGSGVFINGEQVAIISGNLESPTLTNAEGDPLTEAELAALEDLFEGIGDVFEVFFEIFLFGTFLLSLSA